MHAVTLYRLGGQGSSWGGVVRSRVRLVERGRRVGADEAVPALSALVPQGAFGPGYPSSAFSIVNNDADGKTVLAYVPPLLPRCGAGILQDRPNDADMNVDVSVDVARNRARRSTRAGRTRGRPHPLRDRATSL